MCIVPEVWAMVIAYVCSALQLNVAKGEANVYIRIRFQDACVAEKQRIRRAIWNTLCLLIHKMLDFDLVAYY